jgi:hypothetical protein
MSVREVAVTLLLPDKATKRKSSGLGHTFVASPPCGPWPPIPVEAFGADLLPLQGTSGTALVEEMVAAGPEWRLADLAPRLAFLRRNLGGLG